MTSGQQEHGTGARGTSVNEAIADWFDDTLRIYGEMVESQRRLAVALMRAGTTGFGLAERAGETAQRLSSLAAERTRPAAPARPGPVVDAPAAPVPAPQASATATAQQDGPPVADEAGHEQITDDSRAEAERDTSVDAPAEGVDRAISPEEPVGEDAERDGGTEDVDDVQATDVEDRGAEDTDTSGEDTEDTEARDVEDRGAQDTDTGDEDTETYTGDTDADADALGVADADDIGAEAGGRDEGEPATGAGLRAARTAPADRDEAGDARGRVPRAGTARRTSSGTARTTRRTTGRDADGFGGSRSGSSGAEGSSRSTGSTGGRRTRSKPQ